MMDDIRESENNVKYPRIPFVSPNIGDRIQNILYI